MVRTKVNQGFQTDIQTDIQRELVGFTIVIKGEENSCEKPNGCSELIRRSERHGNGAGVWDGSSNTSFIERGLSRKSKILHCRSRMLKDVMK